MISSNKSNLIIRIKITDINEIKQIKWEKCLYTVVAGSQMPNHISVYILDTNEIKVISWEFFLYSQVI